MSESRYHIGDSQDAAGSDSCDNSREAKSPASALTPRGRGRTSKEFDVDSMPPSAPDAQPPIPYYSDDLVTLYHGDCREITAWLEADVLVTDPPYGRAWRQGRIEGRGGDRRPSDASASHAGIANDATTELRDYVLSEWSGPAAVFGDLLLAPPIGTQQVLIYRKPSSAGMRGATAGHRRDVEAIYLLGWWSGLGGQSSVLEAGYANVATGPAANGHPHAKSNATMQHLVSLAADSATITDPFAGSGSTLVAAKSLGRRAIGVEIDEAYCEIAARRLAQDTLFGGAA